MKSVDKQAFDAAVESLRNRSPQSIVELLKPIYEVSMVIDWYITEFSDFKELETLFADAEIAEWREESMLILDKS